MTLASLASVNWNLPPEAPFLVDKYLYVITQMDFLSPHNIQTSTLNVQPLLVVNLMRNLGSISPLRAFESMIMKVFV